MKFRMPPKTIANKIGAAVFAASFCLTLSTNITFAGSIELMSVDSGGLQLRDSYTSALSDNGRYVVFTANLIGTSSSQVNTYLRDRATGTTELVSVANDGSTNKGVGGAIDISSDGRYVVFLGKKLDGSTGYIDAYVRDRVTSTTELISINSDGNPGTANKSASNVSISGNGRYVAFVSTSEDLVSNDNNGMTDVFVRDRVNGTTQRISIASDGTQANGDSGGNYLGTAISADGRYVVFSSSASNLVPSDNNGKPDLFVHDRINSFTMRANLTNNGSQMSIGHSGLFGLSSDGRYVVFSSTDSNLVANDSNGQADIFVRDLVSSITERVSIANDGSQTNLQSRDPAISANGRYVSFISMASNLVSGGVPQGFGAFVYDRVAQVTEMVDIPHDGSAANNISFWHSNVSGDGRYVLFHSAATNLVAGGINTNGWNAFIHDRIGGQICQ